MVLRIVLILFLLSSFVFAKHLYPEKYYQDIWCKEQKGQTEVKLIDDTRIDCLTKTHAIEFDFASKWAEAIGQSLHYSNMTKRNAGIVLIIEKSDDYKYFNKIKPLCEKHQITLWEMKPPNKPIKTQEFYNLEKIIELVIGFIKALIKLFSNF